MIGLCGPKCATDLVDDLKVRDMRISGGRGKWRMKMKIAVKEREWKYLPHNRERKKRTGCKGTYSKPVLMPEPESSFEVFCLMQIYLDIEWNFLLFFANSLLAALWNILCFHYSLLSHRLRSAWTSWDTFMSKCGDWNVKCEVAPCLIN